MGDIVWSINPRNDAMQHVLDRMREFAAEILDPKNIEFSFTESVPNNLIITSDKRKNLFMIFKESVNNAAKYSGASKVEIDLSQNDGQVLMSVRDNGTGFDPDTARQGNGLRNMRERAQESGGTVTINSVAGAGTSVTLQMPIT